MSYTGISVRDALDKINSHRGGWYLPQVQRQYVWGDRHESEDYICLLLDSLLQRYPIGGIVLWETDSKIPYREFVGDFKPGGYAHVVSQGMWDAHKFLVYDGQQRLQTLYSVLRHRFNGRILHFDLFFDRSLAEADETGFLFRDADAPEDPRYLDLTWLAKRECTPAQKVALEMWASVLAATDMVLQLRIREHLSALWEIFVDSNVKSLAYFPVKAGTAREVNEVFRRLNTGGIALTQIELVLGKIKATQFDYEERLWELSARIAKKSGGIHFSSAEILQFLHLMVKDTIRIEEDRLTSADIATFQLALADGADPLVEVFEGYLWGRFKINNTSIVPRWLAILPLAAYLQARKKAGHEWRIRALPADEVQKTDQYFLLSQLCDWNTQTMVNAFARAAVAAAKNGEPFPMQEMRAIAIEKNRTDSLSDMRLLGQPWFSLKVIVPDRGFVFHEKKPQLDHIFPKHLQGMDDDYRARVDVLWNLQPMPATINNYKRARAPKEFFGSEDGIKYIGDYDCLPPLGNVLWDDPDLFIAERRSLMCSQLNTRYDLLVQSNEAGSAQVMAKGLNLIEMIK